jgi:DNA repair exonuclease SbcCD ATPase subunit
VALFGRRRDETISIEGEQQRLHAIRIAAEEELGRLRRELVERVSAVEARERELADMLARVRSMASSQWPVEAGGAVVHARGALAAQAQELNRREAELAARERAYLQMEADLMRRAKSRQETPEEQLERIEKRLADLQKAEKAFARTRSELAARNDELDRRALELADQERALSAAGLAGAVPNRAELDELDERLRRLEQTTREAVKAEPGFGDALRALESRGLRDVPGA